MKPLASLVSILAAFICFATACQACLNDRDTLAEEVQGLPDVVQIITGRFERNPPLFYQMRIQRVSAELRNHPALLSDYDDITVACDRLGRDDEALAWMAKKRTHLPVYNGDNPTLKEQWYRYYANIGTCRIHRWIRAGANRSKISEVQQARDEIAKAVAIKPDAHLGREKYQLQVMDWIIRPTTDEADRDAYRNLMSLFSLGRSRPDGTWGYQNEAAYRVMDHRDQLPLYDQAALTLFRNQGEAYGISSSIGSATYIMVMKRQRLSLIDPLMKTQRQEWLSYLLIDADIRIYNWLWSRSDPNLYSQKEAQQNIKDINIAKTELLTALKMKAGSNGIDIGRQLQAINWILRLQSPSPVFDSSWETPAALADFLGVGDGRNPDAARALSGLIVLGNAWESPDIFDALSYSLRDFHHHDRIAELAAFRSRELVEQKHYSLVSGPHFGYEHQMSGSPEEQREYYFLRTEAEQWQKKRTDYMMTRLLAGHHPDTDPTFWKDYHDYGPPKLTIPPDRQITLAMRGLFGYEGAEIITIIAALGIFVAVLSSPFIFYSFYSRRKAKR